MPRMKLFPSTGTDINDNTNNNYNNKDKELDLLPKQQQDVSQETPTKGRSNNCGDGLFRWWMYFTATIYGLLFLSAFGSLIFTLIYDYWWDVTFETDRERDFFQLAMVGFSALFAWVLASMWVAYQVDHDGWAFLCSLPSLGIIALAVVVMAT